MVERVVRLICCVVLFVSCGGVRAQAKKPHSAKPLMNPVFDMEYDPSVAHYDLAPAKIRALCRPRDIDVGLRVYAYVKDGDSDLYIVSGINAYENEYTNGSAIWIGASKCRVADSDWLLDGFRPKKGYAKSGNRMANNMPGFGDDAKVSDPPDTGNFHYEFRSAHEEELLRSLIRDALQRGIRAYASATSFRKLVCPPDIAKDRFSYPNSILDQELRAFCTKAPTEITP